MLQALLRRLEGVAVRIILWNGQEFAPSPHSPVATVTICDRGTLFKLLVNPEIHFGDAYRSGRVRVDGNLAVLLEAVFQSRAGGPPRQLSDARPGGSGSGRSNRDALSLWTKLRARALGYLRANTLRRSRKNIHHHYDIGNDFYKLWLDSQLVYTCAYFPSLDDGLEEAQRAKMDYVCRKLGLRPGETVVEAGCGWGALALHMAKHYGARVKAFNVAGEQIAYARHRAAEEGLTQKVEFIEDDYRNISGRFDVFVSVGMLEHVGLSRYDDLGKAIHRSLGASGRGLLHFIGRDQERPLNGWIRKRIFPGTYPPTLRQAMRVLEPRAFSVLDVENLRLHYARTLAFWLERFEKSADLVSSMFDAEFVRAWRLYLAGSLAAFRTGWLQLFQVTFARTASNEIPWTRAYLYREEKPDPWEQPAFTLPQAPAGRGSGGGLLTQER
ncbi:MAG: class I SAM-dependent methyltransferase [Acidobacteria bacterium]|nr:class I SAM-dependent methyltransferase [Acidobacteriota bacterium]